MHLQYFCQGIYFADRYSKSLDYTDRYNWDKDQLDPQFMLLCEVSILKTKNLYHLQLLAISMKMLYIRSSCM